MAGDWQGPVEVLTSTPCSLQTIAQTYDQMASEDLQRGRLQHLSGQPVPAPSHLALGQLGTHQDAQMLLWKDL